MTDTRDPAMVLIIDDAPDVVIYLKTLLEDNGYSTVSTTESEKGLELAREHRPDLICLDISMPAPSGIRIYRDLRGDPALASIPVVMVTGVPPEFEDFISRRRQVPPPDGYISKPFEPEKLLAVVGELLRPRPAQAH